MKLKVCGLTSVAQLAQVQQAGADYAGLIFYPASKRYAFEKLQAEQDAVKEISIPKVGVFVNADIGFLKSCINQFGLSAVQLHGDEFPEYCAELQQEVTVFKVFRISENTKAIDTLVAAYQNTADYFLFDTDTTGYGGSGTRFDWNVLEQASINKPFFLSGGIAPGDMGVLKSFHHPFFYAADINSRFEISPGVKDMAAVETFVNALKQPLYG